jgi:hypothetical protein
VVSRVNHPSLLIRSTTLNTAVPTTDAAPTLSLGYEPIRNQFTVTIENPTDKTFTGLKAVVSEGTGIPDRILAKEHATDISRPRYVAEEY